MPNPLTINICDGVTGFFAVFGGIESCHAALIRSEGAEEISLGQAVSAAPGENAAGILRPGGALESLDFIGFLRPSRAGTIMPFYPGTATAFAVLSPANFRSPFGTNLPIPAYEQPYSTENSEEPLNHA
jgi:hypothetical protein